MSETPLARFARICRDIARMQAALSNPAAIVYASRIVHAARAVATAKARRARRADLLNPLALRLPAAAGAR